MRGESDRQATMTLGLTPDSFVARDYSLARIKPFADSALGRMSPPNDEMYADHGRPSIPPEHLIKTSMLVAFFTICSGRQLCEQLCFNVLFQWLLDLNVEDEPFHLSTLTKNRGLLGADAARVQHKQARSR